MPPQRLPPRIHHRRGFGGQRTDFSGEQPEKVQRAAVAERGVNRVVQAGLAGHGRGVVPRALGAVDAQAAVGRDQHEDDGIFPQTRKGRIVQKRNGGVAIQGVQHGEAAFGCRLLGNADINAVTPPAVFGKQPACYKTVAAVGFVQRGQIGLLRLVAARRRCGRGGVVGRCTGGQAEQQGKEQGSD